MGGAARTHTRTVTARELAEPLADYMTVRRELLRRADALAPETCPLDAALARVVATDVHCDVDVPAFDNSALDGFAVRARDVEPASREHPVHLTVAGEVRAGETGERVIVEAATAAAIATGAPLPQGADAVVPWEDTDVAEGGRGEEHVAVYAPSKVAAVRMRAEDMRAGDVLARAGTTLGALQLGALAAAGVKDVQVVRRPCVAVLSTGDELAPLGAVLARGQRHDANSTLVSALVREAGGVIDRAATLPDQPAAIRTWLVEAARSADVVVVSGGASVGRHDWVRAAIEQCGELHEWRVAIKPGKPLAIGTIDSTPIFALPGNPASVAVSMHVFVSPFLRMLGGRMPDPAEQVCVLGEALRGDEVRVTFHPVAMRGGVAEPLPTRTSQVISTFAAADGFAVVPPGGIASGGRVTVERTNHGEVS